MRSAERQADAGSDAVAPSGTTAGGEPPAEEAPPVIPDAVRAAARDAPDHWLGAVDPQWPQDRPPPEWAVVGEWRSDEDGDIVAYRANPLYRPSPSVLGWPEPTDPVDAAAQRAATGYGSVDEALAALAAAEVSVVRGLDGRPLTAAGADGRPVILVFTDPTHQFTPASLIHDTLSAAELARDVRESRALLLVNALASAPLAVPAESLPDPVPGEDEGARETGAHESGISAPLPEGSVSAPWPPTSVRTP